MGNIEGDSSALAGTPLRHLETDWKVGLMSGGVAKGVLYDHLIKSLG